MASPKKLKVEVPPDEFFTNCIRCLAADVVQKANSGHPGAPMGMAPVANILWSEVLKFDPAEPEWHNRDRFVSVKRTRQRLALFDASPERVQDHHGRSQGFPPVGIQDAWSP